MISRKDSEPLLGAAVRWQHWGYRTTEVSRWLRPDVTSCWLSCQYGRISAQVALAFSYAAAPGASGSGTCSIFARFVSATKFSFSCHVHCCIVWTRKTAQQLSTHTHKWLMSIYTLIINVFTSNMAIVIAFMTQNKPHSSGCTTKKPQKTNLSWNSIYSSM